MKFDEGQRNSNSSNKVIKIILKNKIDSFDWKSCKNVISQLQFESKNQRNNKVCRSTHRNSAVVKSKLMDTEGKLRTNQNTENYMMNYMKIIKPQEKGMMQTKYSIWKKNTDNLSGKNKFYKFPYASNLVYSNKRNQNVFDFFGSFNSTDYLPKKNYLTTPIARTLKKEDHNPNYEFYHHDILRSNNPNILNKYIEPEYSQIQNQFNTIIHSMNIHQINKEEIKYRIFSTNLKPKIKKIRSTNLLTIVPYNNPLKGLIQKNKKDELDKITKSHITNQKYNENSHLKHLQNILPKIKNYKNNKNHNNKGKINEDVKTIIYQNYGNNFEKYPD